VNYTIKINKLRLFIRELRAKKFLNKILSKTKKTTSATDNRITNNKKNLSAKVRTGR
jgi:hypothetical protein